MADKIVADENRSAVSTDFILRGMRQGGGQWWVQSLGLSPDARSTTSFNSTRQVPGGRYILDGDSGPEDELKRTKEFVQELATRGFAVVKLISAVESTGCRKLDQKERRDSGSGEVCCLNPTDENCTGAMCAYEGGAECDADSESDEAKSGKAEGSESKDAEFMYCHRCDQVLSGDYWDCDGDCENEEGLSLRCNRCFALELQNHRAKNSDKSFAHVLPSALQSIQQHFALAPTSKVAFCTSSIDDGFVRSEGKEIFHWQGNSKGLYTGMQGVLSPVGLLRAKLINLGSDILSCVFQQKLGLLLPALRVRILFYAG
jgi:hypothetical protein